MCGSCGATYMSDPGVAPSPTASPRLGVPLADASLAFAYGATAFLGVASVVTSPHAIGHTEHVESVLFVVSFGLLLPLAVVASRLRVKGLGARDHYALSVANLGAVGLLLIVGRAAFNSGGSPALRKTLFVGALMIIAGNLVAPRLLRHAGSERRDRLLVAFTATLVVAALTLFLPRSVFAGGHQPEMLVLAMIFAFLLAFRGEVRRSVGAVADVLFVIFLFLSSVDMFPYGGSFRSNQDFYLGPVNQILHGQAMLVQTFSQYGVGDMYFLAALFHFVPLGYGGLQLIDGLGTGLELLMIYIVLRVGCRQPVYALVGTLVCLVAAIISGIGPNIGYPSTGALRFGIPWVLVMVVAVRARSTKEGLGLEATMLALVGVASFWSVETFIYTAGTYLAVLTLDAVYVSLGWADRLRYCTRRLATLAGILISAQALFAVATRIWSKSWPEWGGYIAYIRLYSYGKFGTLLVTPWSLGYPVAALYFATAAAVIFLLLQRRSFMLAERTAITAIVASAAFGLLAYTYFLGRSHPNNLHHVSPPAVVVATLWLGLLARSVRSVKVRFALFALGGWAAAGLVAQVHHPAKLIQSRYVLTRSLSVDARRARAVLDDRPPAELAVPAGRLLDRFAPHTSRVAVVLDGNTQTAALMAAHRGNLLPLVDPFQEVLLPTRNLARVYSELGRLGTGQIVVTEQKYLSHWKQTNPSPASFPPLNPIAPAPASDRFQEVVLRSILRRYHYRIIATGPGRLIVLRLGSRVVDR